MVLALVNFRMPKNMVTREVIHLGNLANYMGGLDLPNLQKMGLGNIKKMFGYGPSGNPLAPMVKLTEISTGKDSTSVIGKLAVVPVDFEFPTYPNGFPGGLNGRIS